MVAKTVVILRADEEKLQQEVWLYVVSLASLMQSHYIFFSLI